MQEYIVDGSWYLLIFKCNILSLVVNLLNPLTVYHVNEG